MASGKGFHTGQLLAAVGILAVVLCLAGLGCGLVERRVMRGK